MIDHRGTACHDIMTWLPANLQKAFETRHEVSVLTASQPRGAAFRRACRIGPMRYVTAQDMDDVLAARQQALLHLGCKPAGVL